jgi:ubiquinone biosynthesis UbiH/UbiF/VisC/COQ6 family hydroxylase
MSHHHAHRHTPKIEQPSHANDFDLIIVGGGLTGSALAVSLADTSLRIALVDARAPTRPQGWPAQWDNRVYAISPGSADLLAHIGCWPHLTPDRLQRVEQMVVSGDAGGVINFSAFDIGTEELAWIVESSEMACELWTSVSRQRNVTCFCPAEPRSLQVNADQAVLSLTSGPTLRGKLIVGADGRDSWVRTQMGLSSQHDPYNELGVVANFRTELPHFGTAYQWFRADGVLAYLPLAGGATQDQGKMISMVWSAPEAFANELLNLSAEDLAYRVANAGENKLGRLALMAPAVGFPLKLVRVPQVVAPRVALLGDAAHGIHPLTGHGVNLGFQDVRVLADVIRTARPVDDLGDVRLLSRYQRARREEVVVLQSMTDAMRKLFASKAPGLSPLRNLGLSLTDKLTPIKSMLIRYALER